MQHLKLIELKTTYITSKSGKVVSVEEATPEEFDEWITQYIRVTNVEQDKWPLLMRWKAINFALDENVPLRFVDKLSEDCERVNHVPNTRPDTSNENIVPVEKEEDVLGGKEDILRIP